MARLSTTDLTDKMKATSLLHNWDVLVAYEQDGLNALLKEEHERLASVAATLTFDTEFEDFRNPDNPKDTINWTLKLAAPDLELTGTDCSVEINFKMGGTFRFKSVGKDRDVTAGLSIRCRTTLINVLGQVDWKDTAAATSTPAATSSSTDKPVLFDDKVAQGGHTILDLTQDPSRLVIDIINADGKALVEYDEATRRIRNYFKEKGVKYHIGTISNQSNANTVIAKPQSFVMTAVVGSKTANPPEKSSVLFWINVVGSDDHGKTNTDKNDPLIFSVPKVSGQVSPIPTGKTASIVFSQHFIYTKFVKPALETNGYTSISTTTSSEAGIYISATPKDQVLQIARFVKPKYEKDEGYDEISFNMKDNAASIKLLEKGSKISMSYRKNNCHFWTHSIHSFGQGATVAKDDGYFDATFSIEGSGTWSATSGSEKFSLAFDFPSTFTSNINIKEQGAWDKFFSSRTDRGFAELYNLSVSVPNVKFDMGSLDYFMTTNLLLPGQHVFVPDAIDKGFFIPADILLIGELAKPKSK